MRRYNPQEIEPKWQKIWEETGIYKAVDNDNRPKRYVLEYFPYPSGSAMHVGHVRNYTIGDVISRSMRMQGFNVLHPMGWDAFGLPAENYAIKTGISPKQAVAQNVDNFRAQLMQMGFSYDWSREINSTDPSYYRWTQWFFLLLFRKGLAYQHQSLQWWCPHDKTVLANEQVEDGRCWRCGHLVEKKSLNQWFFKITDYADRLDKDLDDVDWSESIKAMQRNWIGRSRGAEISFKVDSPEHQRDGSKVKEVSVYTTRPDTIFGATFLVMAPELADSKLIATADKAAEVDEYIGKSLAKTEIERQETKGERTGVFTGSYAINPFTKLNIPIWIADYVLGRYGTGAIMAVPAHDQRDLEFAQKFDLPIVNVIEPTFGESQEGEKHKVGVNVILRNPKTNEIIVLDWGPRQKDFGGKMLIGGGVEAGEDIVECAKREIAEETGYTDVKLVAQSDVVGHGHFYSNVKDQHFSIDAHGLMFDLVSDTREDLKLDDGEKNKFTVSWIPVEEAVNSLDDGIHKYFGTTLALNQAYSGEGMMINSGEYDGRQSSDVREQIIAKITDDNIGSERKITKITDWLISRQRYWGAPIPIIHCPVDGAVAVPEDQLPVLLPEIDSYEPSGDGRSPLARIPEFVNTVCPKCGGKAERETDTMDGFACSSWYFLRFADPNNDKLPFDKDKVAHWLPVDDYIGGAEHAVMHLLYARFWTKVMYDEKMIDFNEPFGTLRNHGMILAPDGQKMSKSKGNTIEPSVLIEQGYGADSIRMMELFIGPWNQAANWSVEGLGGMHRFLQRLWVLVGEYKDSTESSQNSTTDTEMISATHKVIQKVTKDITDLSFNTAIASMMGLTNELYKIRGRDGIVLSEGWAFSLNTLIQLLAPFAPHIAEELWAEIGHSMSVHITQWPKWDTELIKEETLTIAVQVNGKVRAEIIVDKDQSPESIIAQAKADKNVIKFLDGKELKKEIYVPGRLVSLVV